MGRGLPVRFGGVPTGRAAWVLPAITALRCRPGSAAAARVVDGTLISAACVTAGIDRALTVAARLRGEGAAQVIQLYMAYAPEPPFDAGTPERALAAGRAHAGAGAITAHRETTAKLIETKLGLAPSGAASG